MIYKKNSGQIKYQNKRFEKILRDKDDYNKPFTKTTADYWCARLKVCKGIIYEKEKNKYKLGYGKIIYDKKYDIYHKCDPRSKDTVQNCSGTWSEWSRCEKGGEEVYCGGGTRSRSFTISKNKVGIGAPCGFTNGEKQTEVCNIKECNIGCEVSEWDNDGSCSKTCGGGKQKQIRQITKSKSGQGKDCPSLIREVDCNTHNCPIDCVGSWSEWSDCTENCGTGTQTRTFNIKTPAQYGGKSCEASQGQIENKLCNQQVCPQDCQVSEWQNEGSCSKICGKGKQKQIRYITKQTIGTGEPCPSLVQNIDCNTQACKKCTGKWIKKTQIGDCKTYQFKIGEGEKDCENQYLLSNSDKVICKTDTYSGSKLYPSCLLFSGTEKTCPQGYFHDEVKGLCFKQDITMKDCTKFCQRNNQWQPDWFIELQNKLQKKLLNPVAVSFDLSTASRPINNKENSINQAYKYYQYNPNDGKYYASNSLKILLKDFPIHQLQKLIQK